MIGIIGAMECEIRGLVDIMSGVTCQKFASKSFYTGKIGSTECVVALSSEGKVNSAVCTQIMIDKYDPDFIINTGVAGGVGSGISIGDIVFAESVVQHDYDVSALGMEKGYVYGIDCIYGRTDEALTRELMEIAEGMSIGVHSGVVASGDQFISSREKKDFIRSTFGAKACEMEAAAIGHVCMLNGKPFAVIRAISDGSDDGAKVDFPVFAEAAAKTTIEILVKFLKKREQR